MPRTPLVDRVLGGERLSMDTDRNATGTRLSCTNPDCDCELQINRPCPHGDTYVCACGHVLHAREVSDAR